MTKTTKILPGHPYHQKTDEQLLYIRKDALQAAHAMRDHDAVAEAKYYDQASDAVSILNWRRQVAIDKEIAKSRRAGHHVSDEEAKAIHALLRGRH